MVRMCSHRGLLALVAFAAAFSLASGGLAVMSIDLGSEYMKIAIVKPGVPMEIVLNKESSRKTPTIVAFRDGERHFASQAENTALKFPHKSVGYLMQIIGRQFDDPQVKLYRERFPHYTLVKDEERGTVMFKIDEDTVYSVEELLAMILEKAKEYAKDFAEQEINDAVITVPPFFNQAERRAVIAAAKMVGINVLQLIGDNAAVALNYGVFRRKNFNATTQYYMFYDMGSTSTTATIVGYNVVKSKEKVHSESNPQLTVKGVGFDRTLGGLEFTLRLRTHLAKAFNAQKKTALKVDENDKAMAKLLKESERVKKVLSANVDHHAQIENLIDEKDMRIPVSRAELEEMTTDLTDRVTRPIEEALKISEITMPEITEVILMGGGTRMPKVQEILMKYLGRTELGKSINTDEAAAMGAVYQAAFLGKGFKVKKFAVREGNIYPINVEFERQKADAEGDDQPKTIKRTLFGRMNPYPQKKVMTFNKHTKDFSFNVVYSGLDFLTESDKQSFGSPLISKYSLEGVENALSKNKDTAEARGIKAHFQMDGSGILSLDNVELVFEKNDSADTTEKSAWSKLGSAIGGLFGSGSDDEPKVEEQPSDTPSAGGGEDAPTADGSDSDAAASAATGDEDEKKEDSSDEDSAKKDDQSSPDDDSETGADSQKDDAEGKKEEADQKEEDEKAGKTGKEDKLEEDEKKGSNDKADKAGSTPSKEDEKSAKEKDTQDKAPKVVSIKEIIKAVPEILDVKDMSEERFKASKKRLNDLRKFDQAKVELEQAKNELEAFIFDFQDKLSQGSHEKCSTPEEREALSTLLSETSDWLYEQSDETKKSDYKEKLRTLKDKTLAISKRVFELEERPKALDALKDALNQSEFFLAAAKNLSGVEDPIFTQVEIETLEKLINETKQWRGDTVAAQKKLQPHENPVLLVEDVGQKIYGLEREKRYLLNKLKNYRPKPKPKDENATKTDANDTTAEATPDQEDIPPFDDTDKTEDDDDDVKEDTETKEEEGKTEDKKPKKKVKAEEDTSPKKKDKKEDKKDDTKPTKKDKTEDKDKQKTDNTSSSKKRPKSKRKEEDRDTEEEVLELDSEDTGKNKKSKKDSKKSSHSEL